MKENNILKEYTKKKKQWEKETLGSGYATAFWSNGRLINGDPQKELENRELRWLSSTLTQYKKEIVEEIRRDIETMEIEDEEWMGITRVSSTYNKALQDVLRVIRAKKMQKKRSQEGEIKDGKIYSLLEGGIQEDEDLLRSLTPPSPKEEDCFICETGVAKRHSHFYEEIIVSPKEKRDMENFMHTTDIKRPRSRSDFFTSPKDTEEKDWNKKVEKVIKKTVRKHEDTEEKCTCPNCEYEIEGREKE